MKYTVIEDHHITSCHQRSFDWFEFFPAFGCKHHRSKVARVVLGAQYMYRAMPRVPLPRTQYNKWARSQVTGRMTNTYDRPTEGQKPNLLLICLMGQSHTPTHLAGSADQHDQHVGWTHMRLRAEFSGSTIHGDVNQGNEHVENMRCQVLGQ